MSILLRLQVLGLRMLMGINALIDRYLMHPLPRRPAFSVTIETKLSQRPGNICLYFYTPMGYKRPSPNQADPSPDKKEYPLLVNFHGGGFTMGHATDDQRWASTVLDEMDVIFVSVGYRKGPECPQPTAVEDCVDALRWLWSHAAEYGIDRQRTMTSGFSAGGNLSLTTLLRHHAERKAEGPDAAAEDGKITGVVAFYPSVDQTIPRDQKSQSNPISITKGTIGPRMYKVFDTCYYGDLPPAARATVNFSPGVLPENTLRNGLPAKIGIYTCEWDPLLVEGENFRKRLKEMGKIVGGTMIVEEPHGFERHPKCDVKKRDSMYKGGVELLKSML